MNETGVLHINKYLKDQENLLAYLQGDRIHSGILLVGTDLEIKLSLAKAIAKYLICPNKKNKNFCGQCNSCNRIDKDLHPDVLVFKEEEETQIKTEAVRELCFQMMVSPIESTAKVCIVQECHRMNPTATNSFLKTLEEPGPNRYFILLSSQPDLLLPTFLSRVIRFQLKPEISGAPLFESKRVEFDTLLNEVQICRSTEKLKELISEKENCFLFLQYLQSRVRSEAIQNPSLALTQKYDVLLNVESRLRSNANSGLMLENLIREQFL